jgi:hypothetical protein
VSTDCWDSEITHFSRLCLGCEGREREEENMYWVWLVSYLNDCF